jgi:iron complex transport system ATP-binding protein
MKDTTAHSTLSAENLTVGYILKGNHTPIVSDISVALYPGELVGLLGINGSGKSTLLRTLAGLQKQLTGSILIKGSSIQELQPIEVAQQLSVVLTNQAISKNLSALELVSLGRQPYVNWLGALSTEDNTAVQEALMATDCIAYAHKKCYELSDGQLQRVLIARALAQDTPIILLDEPLSHLDLHHKAAILKLLKSIAQEQHKTILFSTHDIELVLPLCDRILLLNQGYCTSGTPQVLINKGSFNTMFPSEHVTFDPATGRFSIDK